MWLRGFKSLFSASSPAESQSCKTNSMKHRQLKIFAGPDPEHLQYLHLGQWNRVSGPLFHGEIRIFLEQDEERNDHLPRKKFSIQTIGNYKSPDPNIPLTFDDVIFGISFDRPVDWSNLPVPTWIIKMFHRWLMRVNDDLEIENIFQDNSQTSTGSKSYPPKDSATDSLHELQWNRLFCRRGVPANNNPCKPSISTPIVCAASTMNVLPTQGLLQLVRVNNSQYHHKRGNHLICLPRQIWTKGVSHQYPQELLEFNAFLFSGQSFRNQRSINRNIDDISSPDRRMFLRKSTIVSPAEHRRQFHFEPMANYAFEFHADYFDFLSFELRPKLARQGSRNGQQQPSIMKHAPSILRPLMNGRFSFDVCKYLRNSFRNSDGSFTSTFLLVCKWKRNTGDISNSLHFWCLKFEMTEFE